MLTSDWSADLTVTNLAMAKADLAVARNDGDLERASLLEALIACGGSILVYRPAHRHYSVLFGDIEHARHVAVIVPGVGDELHLRQDWLPSAKKLFEAAASTAVILWKAYDNPRDLLSLTIVAHSFGSVVTGASLADCGLHCTDVVVVGSPGMTVEDLRQLHIRGLGQHRRRRHGTLFVGRRSALVAIGDSRGTGGVDHSSSHGADLDRP
jgi:alpha/beta hydrolase family protein